LLKCALHFSRVRIKAVLCFVHSTEIKRKPTLGSVSQFRSHKTNNLSLLWRMEDLIIR
jgi:hypothetical protein